MSVTQLIEEAAGPYRGFSAEIVVTASPEAGSEGAAAARAGRRAPARRHLRPCQPRRERRRLRPRAASRSPPGGRPARSRSTIADDGPGVPRRRHGRPGRALRHDASRAAPWSDEGWRSHRAWASASSSPRPCWSAPAPPSASTIASGRSAAPSSRSAGRARFSSASRPVQPPAMQDRAGLQRRRCGADSVQLRGLRARRGLGARAEPAILRQAGGS